MRKLAFIQRNDERHWVGDGFPVRTVFSYKELGSELSPFLLLDYAGPADFAPTQHRRGVGEHPHRGFETVTIVYAGEVAHRDSSGAGGTIRTGDVQWMTAASGIVHEEYHGEEFARRGGPFQMVQLWVNLPAKQKMEAPSYQGITSAEIPVARLANESGLVRVIAGRFDRAAGPARTHTRMNVWDVRLKAGNHATFPVPDGDTATVLVLNGRAKVAGGEELGEADLAVLERQGDEFDVAALEDSTLLVLTGEPIEEPIVGYGPFVMNTEPEIRQAFKDYESGKMGRIARAEGRR
ncbi:MAG: pirin family protein [Betaproteobacteria bacterium]